MNKALCSAIALALLFAVSGAAQTAGSGSVAGTVADSSNLVVAGAAVALVNEATAEERNEVTNQIGEFVFPAVVPGTYTIRVHASGFRLLESRGNVLTSSSRLALGTLQLQVGAVTDSVEVSAQAAQVQTDSSDKSELVDLKELQEVAIRGKDPMSFLGTMPGVQKGVDPDYLGGRFGSSIPSFQGLPVATNDMMSDGVNGGDSGGGSVYAATVNLDGIAEVHVLMGSYNAEYGRAGGTMINMITKSGGKDYHGSAWYYKRHEEFNANNYFNNLNGIAKPIYRFNIAGGSVGGPVRLPKLNMKDKLFFFTLYERGEVKNAVPLERWTMPTELERSGNFTQSFNGNNLIVVKDPLTGQSFPGNIIPQSRSNPYSLAEMNILPMPNINGNGYNYVYQEPFVNQPRNSTTSRVDYRPTDKDTISVTYKYWSANLQGVHFSSSPSPWNWVYGEYAFLASQGTINWTRIITPHIVNELFAGGMHDAEQSPPVGPDCAQSGCGQWNPVKRVNHSPLDQLGQFNNTWNPMNWVPQATYAGIPTGFTAAASTFDGREPLTGYDANLTISDNLTYTYGPHTFKTGLWFEHYSNGQAASSNFSGIIDFGQNSLDPTNTGYAFANGYVGHFNQYTEDLGRGQDNAQRNVQAAFLQDTWKINRKLTMDIGMRVYYRDYWPLQSSGVASTLVMSRYDPTWGGNPPVLYRPTLNNGQRVAVNPLTGAFYPQTYIGNIVPGTGNTCNNLSNANPCKLNGIVLQNDKTYEPGRGFRDDPGPQWDPRIGFAYDPFGDGKTAIRASFGEFHEASMGGGGFNRGPAFVYTRTVVSSDLTPALFQSIPLTSPTALVATSIGKSGGMGTVKQAKIPVVLDYLFGIQRDITRGFVLTVQYVGNTQHYVVENYDYNLIPFGARFLPQNADPTSTSGAPLPNAFLGSLTQGYTNMLVSNPAARTRYDSLQTSVRRRFASGLELDGNFTWSKGFGYNTWSQVLPVKDFWGLVATDQTYVANITYVYDFPKFSKWVPGSAAKWFVDNWQISGITTFGSGFPMNITLNTTDNFDFTGGGDVTAQVALTCNPEKSYGDRTFAQFFNTDCVARPAGRGSLGSILNNVPIRGPGFNNWDSSLFKNFPIREKKIIQFRWEVYNVLNHAEASGLNLTSRFNPAGQQTNGAFGQVTSTLPERRMQFSVRFNF